ncbi:MAG: Dyp-type peroxidase [Brevibacterium aurantiacum]|uniref:Peroxidase n=1 Tax=Brevibacterium aurantiacum TaxID=273384 RepID=A0A1D7VYE2_BREAU|nr:MULTISPECIES: Dyp-type peroxidase [Brevibacterium]MDN5552056.1 Dyp-type peroxidase [Brevibacterium sp.]AOP51747.1 putative dye-decolorizing peroxidase (DyP), encapsulated subgroup [Brevibacterium aurantiacum]AZL04182.1 peroxidase [Brevibacterium aurantiacum]AZL07817.1 peroxidase [Brevibacterium aurantiacum]AZL14632.1 peroxidase [Brevibacterium aurantiacum]
MTVQNVALPNGRTPQHVLGPPAPSAIFLVVTVHPGAEAEVKDFLGDVSGLVRTVGFRSREDHLSCVTGIGALLWDRMYSIPRPAQLHPFIEQRGDTHTAPSTPGDILFHIRARRIDLCFELARLIIGEIGSSVDVVDEVHGFRYFDERDILGFVDGTENPEDQEAIDSAYVGPEDPDCEGGSYVIVQKYTHEMKDWESLSVEDQEAAFGRHKLSDMEFDDDDKAANSHLILNTIEDEDGTEHKIVRDNMVFGSVESGEYGTYFIGYAGDPSVTEQMLENMFIGDPPGTYDRILDFSTAETGNLFYVPTQDFLEDPGEDEDAATDDDTGRAEVLAEDSTEPADQTAEEAARDTSDGSLGIGSLKRSRQ